MYAYYHIFEYIVLLIFILKTNADFNSFLILDFFSNFMIKIGFSFLLSHLYLYYNNHLTSL